MVFDSTKSNNYPSIPPSPWVWPAFLLSFAIILLNGIAWSDLPLGNAPLWVLAITGFTGLVFCFRLRPSRRVWFTLLLGILCVWITLSDLAGFSRVTTYVSAHPDAWSYEAVSHYLTDYGRSRTEGMPLIDQYAAHLRHSRFSSSCLLSLCHAIVGSRQIFAAHTLFYATLLLVIFCSVLALSESLGFDGPWPSVGGAIAVLLGWSSNAIVIGNYDNLCFVALLPAAITVLIRLGDDKSAERWKDLTVGLGVLTAAILYTYPEGSVLCGPALLPLLIALLWRATHTGRMLAHLAFTAVVSLFLLTPYAPHFARFLLNQYASGSAIGARPGEGCFPGLLSERLLPSIFAFGTEYPGEEADWWSQSLAIGMMVLILIGFYRLARRSSWSLFSVSIATLLFLWQAFSKHYDYGAYKVLFCHTWLIIPVLLAGISSINQYFRRPVPAFLLAGLVIAAGTERLRHSTNRVWPHSSNRAPIEHLVEIVAHTGSAPVFLDLHNDFDQLWSLVALRDVPLVVMEQRSYLAMPHVKPFLDATRAINDINKNAFILSDKEGLEALWNNDRFTLTRADNVFISAVKNPNGKESVNGRPFVWIGHTLECILIVQASNSGLAKLKATAWWIGPSLPESGHRTLIVNDVQGEHSYSIGGSDPSIVLHLTAGTNTIRLRVAESPSITTQTNGDKRELLLGILGYFLAPVS